MSTVTRLPPDVARRRRVGPPVRAVGVDTLRAHWSAAFGAAEAALGAASPYLPPGELHERHKRLVAERDPTVSLLRALARDRQAGVQYLELLVAPAEARRLLGLPAGVKACIFNLDGVLIGSAALHASAWTETFDEFISRRVERTGGRFAPFNPRVDYPALIHGRPRLEGVRAFLAGRGIRLPEGGPGDLPGAETVHGLANRKNQALLRILDERGVTSFEGSRRYLELAREAGIRCGVVSASANTQTILERAKLADLIDVRIDGNTIVSERLAARPAPDIVLAACRELGAEPGHAAVFETSAAGVAAARAGGFALVIGVDRRGDAKALGREGAQVVVSGLAELLDHGLAA